MASTPPVVPTASSQATQLLVLGEQAVRISQLEAENKALHEELSLLLHQRGTLAHTKKENLPSVVKHDDTEKEATLNSSQALRNAYDNLAAQHAQCDARLARAVSKYEIAKDVVFKWQAYVNSYIDRKKHSKSGSAKARADDDAQQTALTLSAVELPGQLPSPKSKYQQSNITDTHTTSSQTTVSEHENVHTEDLQRDGSEQEPVVVSERQLKRRRMKEPRSPRIKQEKGSVEHPWAILSDDYSTILPTEPDAVSTQMSDLNDTTTARIKNPTFTATPDQRKRALGRADIVHKGVIGDRISNKPAHKRDLLVGSPAKRSILTPISANISRKNTSTRKRAFDTPAKTSTSLRAKPVESLRLGDFRLNPCFFGPTMSFTNNAGKEHGRVCLPGCTREACCGNKYRRMLEIAGAQVTGKTDREALQEYLGPDYREIMAAYGPEKRQDLIMQAHANCFAHQAGASTKSSDRATTPPGFWRTDMPTTQELASHKQEAEDMVKRKIAERHHEALREGGRWIFRDES